MRIACFIVCNKTFVQVQAAISSESVSCDRYTGQTELLTAIRRNAFDLVVVDSETPGATWLCSWLACRHAEDLPYIVLTQDWDAGQIAAALESGAEDVISCHAEVVEIKARVQVLLRRYGKTGRRQQLDVCDFNLNRDTSTIKSRGVVVELTPLEFSIAWMLFSFPGTYVTRDTISATLWGVDKKIANRSMEQHIYMLRKKLNLTAERGVQIRTVYNKGYRLELTNHPVRRPTFAEAEALDRAALAA